MRLSSGGLMVNYRCHCACGHCLYLSSPTRDGDYITKDCAKETIARLTRMGCPSLHIGGGEPFLKPEGLLDVLEVMQNAHMPVDYIETNGAWYKDRDSALSLMREVKRLGGSCVMVSTCPYHNEFVPMQKMMDALSAIRDAGLDYFAWQDRFIPDMAKFDPQRVHKRAEYEQRFGKDYWRKLADRFGIGMNGRALLTYRSTMTPRAPQALESFNSPCTQLNTSRHYHIDCKGYFLPSGCMGLSLPLAALEDGYADADYPIYTLLAKGGVKALYEKCISQGFTPRDNYATRCELCIDLRLFLRDSKPGQYKELTPDDYYREYAREASIG